MVSSGLSFLSVQKLDPENVLHLETETSYYNVTQVQITVTQSKMLCYHMS